jgi:hypothetical protein
MWKQLPYVLAGPGHMVGAIASDQADWTIAQGYGFWFLLQVSIIVMLIMWIWVCSRRVWDGCGNANLTWYQFTQ